MEWENTCHFWSKSDKDAFCRGAEAADVPILRTRVRRSRKRKRKRRRRRNEFRIPRRRCPEKGAKPNRVDVVVVVVLVVVAVVVVDLGGTLVLVLPRESRELKRSKFVKRDLGKRRKNVPAIGRPKIRWKKT